MATTRLLPLLLVGLSLASKGCWLATKKGFVDANSLVGQWASESPEPTSTEFGPAFLFRAFTVQHSRYTLRYELSADRGGSARWLAVEAAGAFTTGGREAKPEGAFALDLAIERLTMTPYTPAFVAALNRAPIGRCGASPWRVGLSQDLVPTGGCPALGFTLQTGDVSKDVVKLDGERLFLGHRDPNAPLFSREGARPSSFGLALKRLSAN